MNIQGFVPVIINVAPVNVPLLLGLVDEQGESTEFGFNYRLDPMDRKERVVLNN